MKPLILLALLTFPATAPCQQLPALNVFLDRLDAYAQQYQATLPSLSCDEEITSQALNRHGKVTWEMKLQSSLREIRIASSDSPVVERRIFSLVDGRRASTSFQTSQMPYFVSGGFAGLVGFRLWQQRECFDYALTAGDNDETVRLEMRLKGRPRDSVCDKIPAGFHRVVIAEPDTGRILHTERTIAPEEAEANAEAYFGAIDYAPQRLGDQIFWLPSQFYTHNAQNTRRMTATYSNYHRYTGELRVLPDTH